MILIECQKLWMNRATYLPTFGFYTFFLFCIAFAMGSNPELLALASPSILWALAVLTTFFSIPLFLKNEWMNGTLEETLLLPCHPGFYLLSKVCAEWILFGLPLGFLSVLLYPLFGLSFRETSVFMLTLWISFPAISALGILGSLLTLHARGGSLLLSFLILPLTLPPFLFSLSVLDAVRFGLDSLSAFCLLIGSSIFLVVLSLVAGVGALKQVAEG